MSIMIIILLISILAVTASATTFDCSNEIASIIDIVKKIQPKCDRYDITCIQQNERDIAKLTGEMNFKCLMKKQSCVCSHKENTDTFINIKPLNNEQYKKYIESMIKEHYMNNEDVSNEFDIKKTNMPSLLEYRWD